MEKIIKYRNLLNMLLYMLNVLKEREFCLYEHFYVLQIKTKLSNKYLNAIFFICKLCAIQSLAKGRDLGVL